MRFDLIFIVFEFENRRTRSIFLASLFPVHFQIESEEPMNS